MEKRICGEENELGAIYLKKDRGIPVQGQLGEDFLGNYGFQLNGSKIYEDIGHVEIATAEASTASDLVLISKGCERLVEELFPKEVVIFIKDNTEPVSDKSCFGAHENYLYYDPRAEFFRRDVIQQNLIAFLISRIIFTGGGITLNCLPGMGKFLLSNRARFLTRVRGISSTENQSSIATGGRPLITTKDTHFVDPPYRRLHLSSGDPNMSEFTQYLKYGTMSLFLRLAEDNLLPDPFLRVKNPLLTMNEINADLTFKEPLIELEDGRKLTAVQVQEIFLEQADRYYPRPGDSRQTREEVKDIKKKWALVLGELKKDYRTLWTKLDWVTKRKLDSDFLRRVGVSWQELKASSDPQVILRIKAIEQKYHELSPDGIYRKLCQQNKVDRIVSDREIEEVVYNPLGEKDKERRNRSWARGKLVRWARESDEIFVFYAGWAFFVYKTAEDTKRDLTASFPDEYEEEGVRVSSFFRGRPRIIGLSDPFKWDLPKLRKLVGKL